uniref:Immunoglobulin V-set domain-containing protein n=1 Tax=Cyprinus carpio TaxID=7962 RepID=A0A8C2JVW0_CYPCA
LQFTKSLNLYSNINTVNLSAQAGKNATICSVPIAIVYMVITYQLKEIHKRYLNCFQQDCILMSLNIKNTSLRILNVDVSDSGLYFCGDSRMMTFGDGTNLDIKGNRPYNPISTSDCSENIFYKLTFIFGGIIVILIIIPLTMLII